MIGVNHKVSTLNHMTEVFEDQIDCCKLSVIDAVLPLSVTKLFGEETKRSPVTVDEVLENSANG